MKLGILGGTFDPIHLGHLRTAEETGRRLGLEKVYLIPSASPPHKIKEPITPFYHRLAMVRLASADSPLLEVLDLEGKRPGFSYSIETLRKMHSIFSPDPELFFILGMDAFLEIDTWKEYKKLFDAAHFVIILRAGFQTDKLDTFVHGLRMGAKKTRQADVYTTQSGNNLIFLKSTLIDISSTQIRKMVMEGVSIRFLLPEAVRHYIIEKGLYNNYEVS